ncbi:Zinc finger C2H2-type protein [Lasiodiplodia theobromae]|nr:Zinc finger C2H2-type protein [Lasiodiplodia theobromae]
MREKVTSPPKLTADDAVYEHLCGDIRSRTKEEPDLTAIPKSKELERLMEAYVSCFHCHFPIIHIASLDLPTAPGPLILSICAIGALYRLDRRRAVQLHNIASSSLHRSVSSQPPSFSSPASARPLWVVQSCLLLSMYAAFSGQSAAVLSTVEKMGFFKIEFQLKRTALQKSALEQSSPCWDEWIRRESSKRLLCGIFIMTNLFSVTYGTTPLFSIEQDLTFETPSEEKLWDARTAELWEDARASRHAASAPTTLREAIVATFFNQPPDSGPAPPPQISGFTALLITHAANVHMWSIIQFSASFPAPLSHSILTTTFASLVRWHTALGHGSVETPEAAYYNNASSIPLVFNCHALLRIAYVRLFGNSCAFPKMILLASDDGEIAAAMANYVAAPQPRNAFLTKSIAKAYEGFITPVRLGHLLIKKTAALSWSVEHAVAAWDSVLFVSKWVHAVQMEGGAADGEEERIVAQLEGLLEEMEYGYNGVGSLAAAVTRAWAGFLTDTWVWGVTPRMGYILMQLATAYDNAYQAALS